MNFATDAPYQHKIKSVDEVRQIIGPRPREEKVIMCHGNFDIVHPGHLRHLIYAKNHADILIASITCDAHILKANVRPYVPEDLRALNLAAFEMVDYVVIDREPTPLENLHRLQPDFFAKGFEYATHGLHPKNRIVGRPNPSRRLAASRSSNIMLNWPVRSPVFRHLQCIDCYSAVICGASDNIKTLTPLPISGRGVAPTEPETETGTG